MAAPALLPSDLVHAFVKVIEAGSVTAAATRLGRTQSAVSLQLRRLEEHLGMALFARSGRGLEPTAAARTFLPHARAILSAHAAAVEALDPARLRGTVRLGTIQDAGESLLPGVLRRFSSLHPSVALDITIGGSRALRDSRDRGGLDVTLTLDDGTDSTATARVAVPMAWLASATEPLPSAEGAVPLALLSPPCTFRAAALSALEDAGRAYRITATGPGLSGILAAVRAGVAITARTPASCTTEIRALTSAETEALRLPSLPMAHHALHESPDCPPPARRLSAMLAEALTTMPS